MLKEELFINPLDKVQLKRIYIDNVEDDLIHKIKDKTTGNMYEEVVVLPETLINNFEEIIYERNIGNGNLQTI